MKNPLVSNLFAVAAALAALSGSSNASADPTTCIATDTAGTAATVQNMPAAEYFGRFIYDGSATSMKDSGGSTCYRELGTAQFMEIADGVRAEGAMYLHSDCTYEYFYSEGRATSDGMWNDHVVLVTGNWQIQGISVVFNNLGKASGLTVHTFDGNAKPIAVDGLSINFDRDLVTPGLTAQANVLVPKLSTASIQDARASVRP